MTREKAIEIANQEAAEWFPDACEVLNMKDASVEDIRACLRRIYASGLAVGLLSALEAEARISAMEAEARKSTNSGDSEPTET